MASHSGQIQENSWIASSPIVAQALGEAAAAADSSNYWFQCYTATLQRHYCDAFFLWWSAFLKLYRNTWYFPGFLLSVSHQLHCDWLNKHQQQLVPVIHCYSATVLYCDAFLKLCRNMLCFSQWVSLVLLISNTVIGWTNISNYWCQSYTVTAPLSSTAMLFSSVTETLGIFLRFLHGFADQQHCDWLNR